MAWAAAAALAALPASAAPPQWKTLTASRHAGPVSATMTIQRRVRGPGFYEFRKLRLVVRAGGKTVVDRLLCANLRCGPGSHHDLTLENVYDGPRRARAHLPQRVCGNPRSTFEVAGSGQREVTTFVRV